VNSHGTLALQSSDPAMLGMSALISGTHVSVYGTRSGTIVADTLIAAVPIRQAGTVLSNQNGTMAVKTKTHLTLTIPEANVPGTKMLEKIKAGHHVIVVLNPATHESLSVVPRHVIHHGKIETSGRWAVGTLALESTQSLSMHNSLGSVSIPLAGRTIKVMWPQHDGASLSQIPMGTPLTVHLTSKSTLIIHVS
jgi:hypothetical protein